MAVSFDDMFHCYIGLGQTRRERSTPVALVDDVGTNRCCVVVMDSHDSVQRFTDSSRRAVDTSCRAL